MGNPKVLALDAEHVYWSASSSVTAQLQAVWKLPKHGGQPTLVVRDLAYLVSIAAFEGDLYWSVTSPAGKIFKHAEGSTGPTELVAAAGYPVQLAVNRHGVFWVDAAGGTVNRVAADGTGKTVIATGQRGPEAVALDDTHVYWLNNGSEHKVFAFTVMKAPIGGGAAVSVVGDQTFARGLALDATDVYVTTPDRLFRVAKDGTGLRALAANESVTGAPVTSRGRVHFGVSRPDGASLMSLALSAPTPTPVATGLKQPVALAGDSSGVYWMTADGTLTRRCD